MTGSKQTDLHLPEDLFGDCTALVKIADATPTPLPSLTFTQTPAGLYCGLSFTQPSIITSSGAPLHEQQNALLALSEEPARLLELETPVRFDARLTLTWEQYERIEAALDTILADRTHPVGVCLIAAHVWMGMLRRMLAVAAAGAGEGYPHDTAAKERGLSPARAEAFNYYIQSTTRGHFARAFQIATRPSRHKTVRRMVLGTILSFRRNLRPGITRLEAVGRVAFHNLRHWARIGHVHFDPWGYKLHYTQLQHEQADLGGAEAQELLRHYFRHTLFRKEWILHTDVFWGLCYQIIVYGLIDWHTAALRVKEGQADVGKALSAVESLFVRNTSFNASYLYHPVLGDIFGHLFKQAAFAHRIIHE